MCDHTSTPRTYNGLAEIKDKKINKFYGNEDTKNGLRNLAMEMME